MGGPSKTDKGPMLNEWAWMGVALLALAAMTAGLVNLFFVLAGDSGIVGLLV